MSSIRPFREILRRKTKKIKVGNVYVGGDAPISVQSMTNTLTTDAKATILLEFLVQMKSLQRH
jgi:(E)-4-hydroxy-3-methylbut-2-enyl-diphosphate synthase